MTFIAHVLLEQKGFLSVEKPEATLATVRVPFQQRLELRSFL